MPYKKREKRLAYMKRYNEARANRRTQIEKAIREGRFKEAKEILKQKIIAAPGLVAG